MWKGKETKQKVERKGDNKERECNTCFPHPFVYLSVTFKTEDIY